MKRKSYRPYVLLALFLFGCLNLPSFVIAPFQSGAVRLSHPLWKKMSILGQSFVITPSMSKESRDEEVLKLEAENAKLMRQNEQLKKRLLSDDRIESHFKSLKHQLTDPFFVRRQTHLKTRLELEAKSLFAQVVYRQPSAWSSSVWIDVGRRDNEAVGFTIVSENSPVLSGEHLIGIIEAVGEKQSRVRLVTDSSLVVSVRVVRGTAQKREMLQLVDQLALELALQGNELLPTQQEKILAEKLGELKEGLQKDAKTKYLAKGELFGTSSPLWRSRSPVLKGVGFNYDFEDSEGPARELRTGKPYSHLIQDGGIALIQEGDLLVTTGMDGIFPADLPVAFVSKVEPLKEGEATYSIEAKLCASEIESISSVVVLPSLEVMREELK
ncbi:rod shape-determining protein MreC [Simkania sp.]|uniref:rod shape-determining protein MreC n=1 Tax=Simkania sp. TaxID=34094 RepID=UPI003B51C968